MGRHHESTCDQNGRCFRRNRHHYKAKLQVALIASTDTQLDAYCDAAGGAALPPRTHQAPASWLGLWKPPRPVKTEIPGGGTTPKLWIYVRKVSAELRRTRCCTDSVQNAVKLYSVNGCPGGTSNAPFG